MLSRLVLLFVIDWRQLNIRSEDGWLECREFLLEPLVLRVAVELVRPSIFFEKPGSVRKRFWYAQSWRKTLMWPM